MQRIERYGVIALVFLLVTVAAVSFWGEGRGKKPKAPAQDPVARIDEPAAQAPERTPERARDGRRENRGEADSPVPLNGREARGRARDAGEIVEIDALPAEEGADEQLADSQAADAGAEVAPGALAPDELAAAGEDPTYDWADRISGRAVRDQPVEGRGGASANEPREGRSTDAGAAFAWHDVQSNETLSEIASQRLGKAARWPEIQALNPGLTPESLQAGTRIRIPGDGAHGNGAPASAAPATERPPAATPDKRAKTPTAPTPSGSQGRTYVVKNGDTLSRIAERELGDAKRYKEIVALNPGLNPDVVLAGTQLRLPASAAGTRSIAQASSAPANEARRDTPRKPRVQ